MICLHYFTFSVTVSASHRPISTGHTCKRHYYRYCYFDIYPVFSSFAPKTHTHIWFECVLSNMVTRPPNGSKRVRASQKVQNISDGAVSIPLSTVHLQIKHALKQRHSIHHLWNHFEKLTLLRILAITCPISERMLGFLDFGKNKNENGIQNFKFHNFAFNEDRSIHFFALT